MLLFGVLAKQYKKRPSQIKALVNRIDEILEQKEMKDLEHNIN